MTPVKVVSIVGNTGDGKSHTLNHVFFDGQEVFATSSQPASCTLGVWAAFDKATNTIVLDTEGMMGSSGNSNQRIRMLLKVLRPHCVHDSYFSNTISILVSAWRRPLHLCGDWCTWLRNVLSPCCHGYSCKQAVIVVGQCVSTWSTSDGSRRLGQGINEDTHDVFVCCHSGL